MAYSDYEHPVQVLPSGYTAGTGTIEFTTGTSSLLPELTDAETNATTGDFRRLMYGLSEGLYQKYNAIPDADKPTKLIIGRSTTENSNTGEFSRTYSFQFQLDATGFEVADET